MKKVLTAVSCLGLFAVAHSAEIRWIGQDGGDWQDDANWEGGSKPGTSDTAVFSAEAGVTNGVNLNADVSIAGLNFTGGTWCFGATNKFVSGWSQLNLLKNQKERYINLAGDGTGVAILNVASTAQLFCTNTIRPSTTKNITLEKTGTGNLLMIGNVGDKNHVWANICMFGGTWKPLSSTWSYFIRQTSIWT